MNAPDYSRYDETQLRQVLGRIDGQQFPERVAAIEERLAALAQQAGPTESLPGNGGAHDGGSAVLGRADAARLRGPGWCWAACAALEAVRLFWQLQTPEAGLTFNLLPALAALVLLNGALGALMLVRWVSWLALPMLAWGVVMHFVQPAALTQAQLRLAALPTLAGWASSLVLFLLTAWTARRLAVVVQARAAAGRKPYRMRVPLALGVAGSIVSAVLMWQMLGGERAEHAKLLAMLKVPGNHKFYVSGLYVQKNSAGTFNRATVMFWNQEELGHINVGWKE